MRTIEVTELVENERYKIL